MSFRHISAAQVQPTKRYHNGLPEGWNRDRFRQLCVSYARIKGASAQCIQTLEISIDLISPTAFKDVAQEPFCYAKQETLIAMRGLTDKTIYNHERQLESMGFLERRLGANGSRCKRKGLGLYLTPALNMIPDMLDAIARDQAEKKQHHELRGDRSRLYRYVKGTLTVLAALPCPPDNIDELMDAFRSWPRSDKLKYMSLARLREHVQAAHDLWERAESIVQKPAKISGQPEPDFGCHIQDQIEEYTLSCNADGETTRPSANASEPDCSSSGPDGPTHCLENKHEADNGLSNPQKMPKIPPRFFYELASPELRMHINIAGGGTENPNPSWHDIEKGTWTRLSEIGTNISAWHDALKRLSPLGAMIAGLITDARLTDPNQHPVGNPGGYFRGMINADERGELNLISSYMGLLARRAKEDECAPIT